MKTNNTKKRNDLYLQRANLYMTDAVVSILATNASLFFLQKTKKYRNNFIHLPKKWIFYNIQFIKCKMPRNFSSLFFDGVTYSPFSFSFISRRKLLIRHTYFITDKIFIVMVYHMHDETPNIVMNIIMTHTVMSA